MKHILILLLACMTILSAQISAEHTYSGTLYGVTLHNGDHKNMLINYTNNTLLLYNTDHTLFKTVTIPVPAGYAIYYVSVITDKLFDNDDQIEAAVTFSRSDTVGTYYIGRVIEESGSILLEVSNCYSFAAIGKSSSYKLHALQAAISNDGSYYAYSTQVYSVPGSINQISQNDDNKYNVLAMNYPNPANGAICINYTLPQNLSTADLNLYNAAGQLISVHRLEGNVGNYLLQTTSLVSGIYFYQIKNGTTAGKYNKLTVLK